MSSTADSSIPQGFREMMEDNDWSEDERQAWRVLHEAREGDMVLWADRSIAMEVVGREQDDEGHHVLTVDKPRGEGTYEVHERYNRGNPKFTSPIGRANNLHFVDRTEAPRGLSEDEYTELVERLAENAVDTFMRLDYNDWPVAVADVVETWSEDVSLRRWRGYKHHGDWQDGDPQAIFESVVEHAMEQGGGGRSEQPDGEDSLPVREQAEIVLEDRVYVEGQEQAEASLIASETDYRETVESLAHHTADRIERKNYSDARVATRDTISDWIDDRESPALQSAIQYGNNRFDDEDYAELSMEEEERERAFDILDHEVWEEVNQMQRERGEHDPTVRGLTYTTYRDLIDALVEDTMRRYGGAGFLRTTVKDVTEDWADSVEAAEWQGHRHRVYAAGDAEDIFASAAIHSEANPFVWNPLADDKERRMAVQAVTADVVDAAETAIDEGQYDSEPVPADDYLTDELGLDGVTYDDFRSAHPEDVDEVVERVVASMEGDEVGWTFVDEIIESDGVVPEATNDWILVDYGVIRENERLRKLAWFDRGSGNVLVLSGMATAAPEDLAEADVAYDGFHISLHEYGEPQPEFLLSDAPLEDALDFAYDYLDADSADFRVIESSDEVWVQEQINDEDINAGGVVDALIPNMPWGTDDLITLADSTARRGGSAISDWGPELAKMTGYVVMAWAPKWAGDRLDGIRVEPNIHKRHGVGTNISKEFGAAPYEEGIGGRANVDLNIRPKTFSNLGEKYAPKFVRYGFSEGDIGKGAVRSAREGLDDIRSNSWGRAFMDTFGGSIEGVEKALKSGSVEARQQQMARNALANEKGVAPDDITKDEVRTYLNSDQSDMPDWMRGAPDGLSFDADDEEQFKDYISDEDFSWDDFERQDLGISGMLMRGLDSEQLVSSAEFLNIDKWLKSNFTLYGSDYVNGDPPTFEEWEEARYGPGKDGGPEAEAQRRARFAKEVAGADAPPDPISDMGYTEDEVDDLGDYQNTQYDSDDTFSDGFDETAEKFASNEPVDDEDDSQ